LTEDTRGIVHGPGKGILDPHLEGRKTNPVRVLWSLEAYSEE